MRYVAGQDLNLLERARLVTLSPVADSLFPPLRLWDGYGDSICRFGSVTANPSVTADLAFLDSSGGDNGNLDSFPGGVPTAWVVTATGGGAVTQVSPGRGGAGSAAQLQKNAGVASIKKTYRVRAGERLTVECYLARNGAGIGSAQLYDPGTRKYLTSGGAWQTAQAFFATESANATYQQKTVPFQVDGFLAHQGPTAFLEYTVSDTGAGGGGDNALVDDVFIWPNWNAAVGVGHNIDAGTLVELRSDTAAFAGAGTVEATPTPTRPSFYAYLVAASSRRWVRLLLNGTQSAQAGAAYLGELAVCYLETALTPQRWDWEMQFIDDQIRNGSSHIAVMAQSIDARRQIRMSFSRRTDAGYREARDEIVRRCRGGVWPAIVAPMDGEDIVIHGRLDATWKVGRHFITNWLDDLVVTETALPFVTS